MGFLDGFLEKLGASLATRYGKVVEGKHQGCSIILGNDPQKKVEVKNSCTQIAFLDDQKKTQGRYDIQKEILEVKYEEKIEIGYRCELTFQNGETCKFNLFGTKAKFFVSNLAFCMDEETKKFFEEEFRI